MSRIQGRSDPARRSPSAGRGGGRCSSKSFLSGSGASQVTLKTRGLRRARRSLPGAPGAAASPSAGSSGSGGSAVSAGGGAAGGGAAGCAGCAHAAAQAAKPSTRVTSVLASLMGPCFDVGDGPWFTPLPGSGSVPGLLGSLDPLLQPLDRVAQLGYRAHEVLHLDARGDERGFLGPVFGCALGRAHPGLARKASEAARALRHPTRRDIAHHPGEVLLVVPGEMAREGG